MAVVVDNARLFDAERALAERESAARREIEAVSRAMVAGMADTEAVSFDAKLDRMLAEVADVLGYERLRFIAREPDGRLRLRGAYGFPDEKADDWEDGGHGSIAGQVLAAGRPLLRDQAGSAGARCELAVPVRVDGQLLGVLNAQASTAGAFDGEEVARLSRIAGQLAVVIERARLSELEAATVTRLHELDQMKDDFVAMTSHELRTPLTVIRGFIRTLLRPDLQLDAPQQRHFIEVIDRQTSRLARLVEDLLLVSRMESGALEVTYATYDPARLLAEYAEEWSAEPNRVAVTIDPDLPKIRTDPDRLAQILRNLVDNALRYGAGSPVEVRARRDVDDLVVEVSDQGPGIPPEELPHVFERFRQAGSSLQHRAGMGLGLYITRQLVTALGGSIEVDSGAGRGTTFLVRLPGLRSVAGPPESARPGPAPGASA
jgi:signal transduction histidine kinase